MSLVSRLRPSSLPAEPDSPAGWIVVSAAFMLISVALGAQYLVIVGLKPVAADFDWPRWIPSLAYSLVALGSGVGGILAGWWVERRGLAVPLFLSAATLLSGSFLIARAEDAITFLLVAGILIGILGNGMLFAPLIAHATKWFDRRRGVAVAVVTSGQGVAGAVWAPIFGWLITEIGWREAWMIYGIAAAAAIVPLAFIVKRTPPLTAPTTGAAAATHGITVPTRLPKAVAQVILCLAIIGCCIAMAMPMVHLVAYCSDLGFDPNRGAEMLSLLLACGVVSRLVFGWISDRIGGLYTILIGSSLQACALAGFLVIDDLAGLYVLSAVFGLVFGGIVPAYALATRQLFPTREAGWRIGIIFLAGYVGMASGGFLGGWIFDLTLTYDAAFAVGVLFNVINLVAIGTLLISRPRAGRTEEASTSVPRPA